MLIRTLCLVKLIGYNAGSQGKSKLKDSNSYRFTNKEAISKKQEVMEEQTVSFACEKEANYSCSMWIRAVQYSLETKSLGRIRHDNKNTTHTATHQRDASREYMCVCKKRPTGDLSPVVSEGWQRMRASNVTRSFHSISTSVTEPVCN